MCGSSSTSFTVHHKYCNMEKSLDAFLSEETANTNDCLITVSPSHGGGGGGVGCQNWACVKQNSFLKMTRETKGR